MRNVIVVIGSVTAKQYEPMRIQYLRRGIRTKIVRIEYDYLGFESDLDIPSGAAIEMALHDFCDAHDIGHLEVCEVVALPQDVWDGRMESIEHAFGVVHADFWPRLKRVTVVYEDDNGVYYDYI